MVGWISKNNFLEECLCVREYSLYRSNITILQCYTAILALLWEYNTDTYKLYASEFSSVKLYNV